MIKSSYHPICHDSVVSVRSHESCKQFVQVDEIIFVIEYTVARCEIVCAWSFLFDNLECCHRKHRANYHTRHMQALNKLNHGNGRNLDELSAMNSFTQCYFLCKRDLEYNHVNGRKPKTRADYHIIHVRMFSLKTQHEDVFKPFGQYCININIFEFM